MSKRTTRTYDAEFIERAVKLAVESDSQAQVARDLGVSKNTLYSWVRQYHQEPKAVKTVNNEHVFEELKRLRKENARLKEERDILKKAAAYFAVNSR